MEKTQSNTSNMLILFLLFFYSGGHLNPAVTLALTIVRGLQPMILAPLYILAQLLGGIIGAALARVNVYPYVIFLFFMIGKSEGAQWSLQLC